MKNIIFVLFVLALMVGCQKSNDGERTPPPVTHQFGMMGGSCYDYTSATYTAATNCAGMNSNTNSNYTMQNGVCVSSTGQQVAANLCTQSSTGYYLNNGVCYSSSNQQQVAVTLCSQSTSGYYNNNGVCYSSSTNQQVAMSFCNTNSTLPPNQSMPMPPPMQMPYPGGGPCFGNYIYTGNGYAEYGYCYGTNCRGYTLIEAASGRTVFCQ